MYNQTNNVNIKPKSYLPEFHVSQNDVGRTLTAHLISDEGDITIPAGATVTMAGTKPSGLGYTVTGTIDGSDVSFDTDAVMTDEPGRIVSEIRIVQGDTLVGTTNVVLSVEPNPHPDDTTDGQREPLVNEITALLSQITEQADRVEEYSGKVLNMTVTAHESDEATVTKTEGEVVNLDFGLPRGPQGPQGIPGEDGQDGVTPDFTIGTVETLAPGEQATATITGTDEDPVLNLGIPQGVKGDKGDPGEVSLETLAKVMVSDTASGAIASFSDGSDVLPAKSVLVTLEPKQSGSGTPSPSNIRPISGWDEVETVVSGKNLLNPLTGYTGIGYNKASGTDATLTENSTGITIDGNELSIVISASWGGRVIKTAPLKAGNYRVNIETTNSNQRTSVYAIGTDGNTRGSAYNLSGIGTVTTYKTLYDGESIAIWLGSSVAQTIKVLNPQIEIGTTSTSYEPYQGTTITTTLPQTVYGGTLDVVSGVLTVTHGYISPYNGETINEPWISDRDEYVAGTTPTTGAQVVYPLATPTTIQCDPQTVQTLMGDNNVWGGDAVVVDYYADTKLYIEKVLGA